MDKIRSDNRGCEEFIKNLCAESMRLVLDDYIWKSFGYTERPKRGAIFTKLIKEEDLYCETFLIREIFICGCVSGLFALNYDYLSFLGRKITILL